MHIGTRGICGPSWPVLSSRGVKPGRPGRLIPEKGTALCGVCVLCFGPGPAPTCGSCPRVPTDMHSLALDGAGAVDKLPWRVHAAASGCDLSRVLVERGGELVALRPKSEKSIELIFWSL